MQYVLRVGHGVGIGLTTRASMRKDGACVEEEYTGLPRKNDPIREGGRHTLARAHRAAAAMRVGRMRTS